MTDDPSRDDEAPELRKLLDKMHGEEPSVFDEMEVDNSDQPGAPAGPDLRFEEKEPNLPEREVSPVEAAEPAEEVHERALETESQETSPPQESPLRAPEPQPAFDPEPHMGQFSQEQTPEPMTPSGTPLATKEERLERATSYEPSLTVDLSQASMEVEPAFVTPPDSLKQDLDGLPVALDCSLRSIPKTLGEVSNMRAGEIIMLGCGLEGPIELKANGRTFATGRLVMVDDQLAVEVIEKLES